MAMNLVQHRGALSVWDRNAGSRVWDAERWLLSALAGAMVTAGFRRRSAAGLLLSLGGGALAWWAAAGAEERRAQRHRLGAALPRRGRHTDPVAEASEESFPASDAPAWTPATGNIGPSAAARR